MADTEWTLQGSGLVVRRDDLVEYELEGQEYKLAAMVVGVSAVGYASFGSRHPVGTQLIAAKRVKNRRLPKPEELADTQIAAALVTRKLARRGDKIPLPPALAKTLFSPFDDENPWRVETLLTPEEWKGISRWYPYSLRSLIYDGTWHEMGRYPLRETGYRVMKTLASERGSNLDHYYVLVYCTLQGHEGREKAVTGTPGSIQRIDIRITVHR